MEYSLVEVAAQLPASAEEVERARGYAEARRAENTARAYRSDLKHFHAWCVQRGFPALPTPDSVLALYLSSRAASASVATLARALAAIRAAHRDAGLPRPDGSAVSAVWAGIRRTHGRPASGKAALMSADLVRILPRGEALAEIRDRALLLLGYAAALRRSEIASLGVNSECLSHVVFVDGGLEVVLARSKSDQNGRGSRVGVPNANHTAHCPVEALQRWISAARVDSGPLFRRISRSGEVLPDGLGPQSIAGVVKRRATAAGLDARNLSAHSLRAGFATSAARNGAPAELLMSHLRHASFDTTKRYIRAANPFSASAGRFSGL